MIKVLKSLLVTLLIISSTLAFTPDNINVKAAFRNPEGDILVCDDETELVATYEFEITFE